MSWLTWSKLCCKKTFCWSGKSLGTNSDCTELQGKRYKRLHMLNCRSSLTPSISWYNNLREWFYLFARHWWLLLYLKHTSYSFKPKYIKLKSPLRRFKSEEGARIGREVVGLYISFISAFNFNCLGLTYRQFYKWGMDALALMCW